MKKSLLCVVAFIAFLMTAVCLAEDRAALQRGAKIYMNYCAGCHSLHYLRYKQLGEDLGLVNQKGQLNQQLLKSNLIFTQASINDSIETALPPEDARQWFGLVPPDLSLVAKAKGLDWLREYLNGFYTDPSRPFGVNNRLVHNLAMPDSLAPIKTLPRTKEYQQQLEDLLLFLDYVSEPNKASRYAMGLKTLAGLIPLVLLAGLIFLLYARVCLQLIPPAYVPRTSRGRDQL